MYLMATELYSSVSYTGMEHTTQLCVYVTGICVYMDYKMVLVLDIYCGR